MPAPSLMFEHGLDIAKGWFDPAALDFAAPLSENVTFEVPRGRVVHVNDSGEFEMGVATTEMAIFLLNGSEDYDVSNPGTTPSGNFMHQAIAPKGIMSGVVATGAYEIESTEFNDGVTYAANDTLTATANNTTLATGGVLTNASAVVYTNPVCGVVSRGRFVNSHGIPVLAFWPVYLPIP
jgi:hypothetical protein